jgi:DNA topoisomerase-3
MKDIRTYTTDIVEAVRNYMKTGKNPDLELTCPGCGAKGLSSRVDSISCNSCKFRIRRVHAGLTLSDEQLCELITQGSLPVMDGFRSKFGKPFKAGLRMVAPQTARSTWKAEFYFDSERSTETKAEDDALHAVGTIQVKDQGELELQVNEKQWSVPEFTQSGGRKGFTMSRNILGMEIKEEVLRQVLATGKSELITGFISQRTNRGFDAYLVLDEKKGNVGFEFPPREARQKGTKEKADKKFTAASAAAEDLSKGTRHGSVKVKGKGEYELVETENAWHVDGLTYGKTRKPLVIPHTMCNVNLDAATITQLLTKGKTELIKDFTSHKSGKKFDAYLVLNASTGRVSYEFPPRK